MATPPSFSVGQVLTSGAMNSVGLWKVASGSLSGNATNIVGCFNTDFDNYVLTLDGVSTSSAADIYWQWLNGTTPFTSAGYMWAVQGITISGATANAASSGQTFGFLGLTLGAGVAGAKVGHMSCTIFNPMNTTVDRQPIIGQTSSFPSDWGMRSFMTQFNGGGTARDGIRLLTAGAPTMAGSYTIYGYRK